MKEGDPFILWLPSLDAFALETIRLESLSKEGVNELLSETLHLFPRITRPLASILHHKTRGNPVSRPWRLISSLDLISCYELFCSNSYF